MDTNALKKFAQAARNLLIDQVTSKLDLVLVDGSAAWREHPQAMKDLDAAIARDGRQQVIEQVAYTWFNRFTALRFMDANDYTSVGIVSPADGQTRPEILSEAMAGNFPEDAPEKVVALLDGRIPSSDPQAEAYRLLLVHACNQWHGPMPFLFEQIDDYSELLMPEDLLSQTSILAEVRAVMTDDACQDVEIIGWLYQFYISEKKDQVFAGLKKNQKITAENIPAATQLFTPHWIVRYLVENSLGRLWLLNRPDSKLAAQMDYYIAPEEPETDFLAIARPEDIRICDPAAGSGHMLTYAFDLLYAIYEEEGYDATEIPALILTHNLTGVEIDDRAGALAAFALAMKAAAKLGRRRFLHMKAKPDICVLQNVSFTAAEMQDVFAVVGRALFTVELRETLGQFEQAKNFGSLIVPKLRDPAETLRVVEARDFGGDLLLKEVQARVIAVLRMAEALSPKYHVVVANPPYMFAKGMNETLAKLAKQSYPNTKSDLFAIFMEVCQRLATSDGYFALINMQTWMFLPSFEKFRNALFADNTIVSMAHIGERGFDTIGGAVVSTTAFVAKRSFAPDYYGTFMRLVEGNSENEKSATFKDALAFDAGSVKFTANTRSFKNFAGCPVSYWVSEKIMNIFNESEPLSSIVDGRVGLMTSENDRFLIYFWEIGQNTTCFDATDDDSAAESGRKWFPHNKGGSPRKWAGNYEYVVNWGNYGEEIKKTVLEKYPYLNGNPNFVVHDDGFYFKPFVGWSHTSSELAFRFYGPGLTSNVKGMSAFSKSPDISLEALLMYLKTKFVSSVAPILNPSLSFGINNLYGLPAAVSEYNKTVPDARKLISTAKSDWDAYETSWDFTTLPLLQPYYRVETMEHTYMFHPG
jgi:hypothetical protein